MFYSANVLSLKSGNSGLGVVWLAGTLGHRSQAKRLQRRDYCAVNVHAACEYLQHPPEPLSLRLSAALMVGIARVYGQQCSFFYGDVTLLWNKLEQCYFETAAKKGSSGDLDMPVQRARHDAITLETRAEPPADNTSVSNIWSELDRLKAQHLDTPEVGRTRAVAGSAVSSSSKLEVPGRFTNSTIPSPLNTNGGAFGGAGEIDSALLRELLGEELGTPGSGDDPLLSGVFRPAVHPGSLLDVPEDVRLVLPAKKKRQIAFMDEETMLSREEMFREPVIENTHLQHGQRSIDESYLAELLKRQCVDMGVPHMAWSNLVDGQNLSIVLPPKKARRRSSGASSATATESNYSVDEVHRNDSSVLVGGDLVFDDPNVLMPWSEPVSDPGLQHPQSPSSTASRASSRDSMGFLRFIQSVSPLKARNDELLFESIFSPGTVTRRVAARAFHNLLQAASESRIVADQHVPFGRIHIHIAS